MPDMKNRWRNTNTTSMGTVISTAPVMIEAQDTRVKPMSEPKATGAVIIDGSEETRSGQR